jgi:hypothetical protein
MLLFTYPRDFRLRFESEMVATFSDLVGGEWEHRGLAGVARVWRSALAEVFSVAVPLQLQSSIVVATLLWSSALFMVQCRVRATANSYVVQRLKRFRPRKSR